MTLLPDGKNNPAHYNLIGKPKVMPNLKFFGINLNVLEGELPEWILYHPHLMEWDPETIVFNQSGDINNFEGKRPGFTNVPENMNYYYEGISAQETGGLCGGQVKSGYENEVQIYIHCTGNGCGTFCLQREGSGEACRR